MPEQELSKGFGGMFRDSTFSDFTINVGTTVFNVHKVIISSRSRYFKNACEGKFKVRYVVHGADETTH